MRLTSLEIRKQEFKKVLRGFDPLEVETFLEMVADEYESVAKSRTEFAEKVSKLEARLKEFQQMETTLQKTLVEAQNTADQSKQNTKIEANLVIKEAEIQAEKISDDVRLEANRLKSEVAMLRNQKKSLTSRLKHLLNSQIQLIEVLEADDMEELAIEKPVKTEEKVNNLKPPVEQEKISKKTMDAPKPPLPEISQPKPVQKPPVKREMHSEPVKLPETKEDTGTVKKDPASSKGDTGDLIDRMILENEKNEETDKEDKRDSNDENAGD